MAEKRPRALFEETGAQSAAEPAVVPGAAAQRKTALRHRLAWWQWLLALLVVLTVLVGGMTRLTDSGLSITEWNLVTGVLPPLSETGWESEFAKYQTIPEFTEVNPDMTMAEFRSIYWWEWGHRIMGRIVGLAFLIPFLWFLLRRAIPPGWTKRLAIPGVLIVAQGVIGWWMVTSGLSGRVDVAPYRLALHLGLAFVIFMLLIWNALALGRADHDLVAARRRRLKPILGFGGMAMALLFLQILAGAMVAGLDAGRGYTDWPLMHGSVFPPDTTSEAIWQFIHRVLGYVVVIVLLVFAWRGWRSRHGQMRFWAGIAALAAVGQMLWGIVTLMAGAPAGYAIFHQLGALALVALLLRAKFEAAYPAEQRIERA